MRYILILIFFLLVSCNEPSNKSNLAFSGDQAVSFSINNSDIYISRAFGLIGNSNQAFISTQKKDLVSTVILTFDDGFISHYEQVAPLLENLGVRAGFAVIHSSIGNVNNMSFDQLRDLQSRGFEIMNHSLRHKDLRSDTESLEVAEEEIIHAKNLLNDEGLSIKSFVSPFSITNSKYLPYVDKDHITAYTDGNRESATEAFWNIDSDIKRLHRFNLFYPIETLKEAVDYAINNKTFITLYGHDINLTHTSLIKIQTIVEYATNLGAKISTPIEAAQDYISDSKVSCNYEKTLKLDVSCNSNGQLIFDDSLVSTRFNSLKNGIYGWFELTNNTVKVTRSNCTYTGEILINKGNIY